MSKTAEMFVSQFHKLPPLDQQGVLKRLLQNSVRKPSRSAKRIPTVKLAGGSITSRQVAAVLEDE